jgi:hypothetical protein
MIARRAFLRGAICGLSFAAKRLPPVALLLSAAGIPANAAWVAALAFVQLALSAVQSFSSSDGGLGAMLRGQHELLQIVIAQLADIQQRLTEISVEIARLEEKIKKIVVENYRDSLINGIAGAAGSYREILASSQNDPNTFTNPAVQQRMSALAQVANLNRNTLAVIAEGYGPETAIAVPIACALEVACSARVGFGKAQILSILDA